MTEEQRQRMLEIMRLYPIDSEDAAPFVQGAVYRGMQITDHPDYNVTWTPGKRLYCPRCFKNGEKSIVEVYATVHACFSNGYIDWIDMPHFCDAFDPVCGWHGEIGECEIVDDNGEV